MYHHHLKRKGGIALAVGAAALYLAAATLGAGGRAGGAVQVFITPSLTGHGGTILLTGAIGDHGTSVKVNAAGQPDQSGADSLAKLKYGSLLLNTAPLRTKIQRGMEQARPDLASCSLHGSTSATVPILSGTGRYKGASGHVRVTFTFAEVGGRFGSGPKKGKCNLAAGPIAQWASIVGTGSVSFK